VPFSGCDTTAARIAEIDAAARTYATTRDSRAREVLVHHCRDLVRGIASEFRNAQQEEDLVQVGYLGLLNAIEHFDPTRGTPFLVFARHFVRGEIRHYLRDHYGVMRRPRWLDRVNGQIEEVVAEHLNARGRYPALDELAERLGLDPATLAEILKTREVVRTLSLDAEDEDGQPTVHPTRADDRGRHWLAAPLEDRMALIEALEHLNVLQRTVIFYIFFTDLTQAETASRIGVSQKHVSRVLASALRRLREILAPDPRVEEPIPTPKILPRTVPAGSGPR
jgi:RNA polymerase sigma-B factor